MPDLYAAGGIPAVQAELAKAGLLDLDVPTVTGKTLGENIAGAHILNDKAIRSIENPYSKTGGLQILWGNIAPDGCVVKRSAVAPEMQVHSGPARVFNSEETAIQAIYDGKIVPGDVVVIRYEGPKGGHRGPDHGRPLLRRFPRRCYRPCQPGGCFRRPHRPD